ncbi:MAG: glycoside hydrolase family 3 C-terminal domain-containing protein [Tannerella sp.]|jgi:beta-glucosidase|nr:glycoside hydrolase family 3 C-terminal domain-containing protein [Tannerella sp.]
MKSRTLILSAIIALRAFVAGHTAAAQFPVYLDDSRPVDVRIEDALSRMTLEEKIALCHAQSKFSTPGCPRLGIPELWMSDGPHGVRAEIAWDDWAEAGWTNDSCTAFPALSCLAATFNPELAGLYGKSLGEEARFRKKDVILGPSVNICRTPLGGRNFEYMGEDPYLTATMATGYIRGVQQNGVAACIKHFALNNQEKFRETVNVDVSDRALHEIYLPAFRAAVLQGKVWTVMGAYNKYMGVHCTHNDRLINRILKGDWQFDGAVVTDWGAAHDTDQAARNGLDIEMGSWTNGLTWGESAAYDGYYLARPFLEKIRNGQLPESLLDDKVRRILRLNFRTNMDRSRPYGSMNTPEHAAVARRVAEEGIVLLKNSRQFFPIPVGKYRKIAVIGENAVKRLTAGGGSSELKARREISPLEGLTEIYGADAIVFSPGYASGKSDYSAEYPSGLDADSLIDAAVRAAASADAVLFFGGLNKNFAQDTEGGDRQSMALSYRQDELIRKLLDVNPRLGVVITSGNPVAMPWIDRVDGLIQSWYLGSQAGPAIAGVVSGAVNPSGKLPFTIPVKLEDNAAHHFGSESYPGVDGVQHYRDDILVGYRWHDTKKIKPLFAFGHGLSYTLYIYGKSAVDKSDCKPHETVRLSIPVKNAGQVAGATALQVYATQRNPSVLRPEKELKAFRKVFLNPGQEQDVVFDIPVDSFAFYDEASAGWKLEDDTYLLHVASASDEILSTIAIKINR